MLTSNLKLEDLQVGLEMENWKNGILESLIIHYSNFDHVYKRLSINNLIHALHRTDVN